MNELITDKQFELLIGIFYLVFFILAGISLLRTEVTGRK